MRGRNSKPSSNKPETQSEIDKLDMQFERGLENLNSLTLSKMNEAPLREVEQQTKLSQKEIGKNEIYLKPKRSLGPGVHPKTGVRETFNENFRKQWEFAKEYVHFIAENKEIIGETIELWTKPFGGVNCEMWEVPVNKPVWGPRYLAERIKGCRYHKLTMVDRPISNDSAGTYYGTMVADSTVNRLDAHPVSEQKSVFMGASGF